jgi:hypothetical protein
MTSSFPLWSPAQLKNNISVWISAYSGKNDHIFRAMAIMKSGPWRSRKTGDNAG